ncbi:MAG: hypothetical protein JNL08_04915 [Planctomycetes bacterium]|nr:hypothetical protein [Planctomycetota bacterium]
MTLPRARGPLRLTFVRCLRAAALPTLLAALAGLWLPHALATPLPGLPSAAGAASPWLQLPLFVAAALCAARAAGFWPLFALRRPGRDVVARLQRGPWRGAGAAIVGALLAQLVLTLPLLTFGARLHGAPATAARHDELAPPPQPALTAATPRLAFTPPARPLASVWLCPLAAPPVGAFVPTRVQLRLDGAVLPGAVATFGQSFEAVELPLPAVTVQRLELEYVDGSVPLLFPRGAVRVVAAGSEPQAWNGAAAAVLLLLPTFAALAFAYLAGAVAALPTVWTVAAVLLFVQTVGGIGPAGDVVLALLRGRWVWPSGTFWHGVPSLAAGSVAMIGGMLLRRGARR